MNKIIFMVVISAFVLGFSSCTNDENPVEETQKSTALVVRTDIQTRATISEFTRGAELGLFVTAGALGYEYNSKSSNSNVCSTYAGTYWEQSPAVYLNNVPAQVFAYYPYDASVSNGKALPVEHLTQKDYMYGTHSEGQNSINNLNPVVQLTMRHALALIVFQFDNCDFSGTGKVTQVGIMNAPDKKILYSEGTMDISTGIITGSEGKNAAAITNEIEENQCAKLMVLPTKVASTGALIVQFMIDGKLYMWKVPEKTTWAGGTKNTYTVKLSDKKITVGNVIIKDWEAGINELAYLN